MSGLKPLSPHLQIYRLPLSAIFSIFNRFTGFILYLSAYAWVSLLLILAFAPSVFPNIQLLLKSFIGRVLLTGWSFSLYYHMINGIRYIIWSFGVGLSPHFVKISNFFVIGSAGWITAIWVFFVDWS